MAASATRLSVKLLIDRKARRVLFAEAGKEVADFLLSLLALPVATAVKLLGKDAMVGCVRNLYASVEKLESTYIQAGAAKKALLSPTVLSSSNPLLRLPEKTIYRCDSTSYVSCRTYVTCVYDRACPTCGDSMSATAELLPSAGSTGRSAAKGFVQGIVRYMVLDNLTVTPITSAVSSITLFNTFAVGGVGDLEEKTVKLGYNEGLAILKASLQSESKTVLTDVFLGDKKPPAGGPA